MNDKIKPEDDNDKALENVSTDREKMNGFARLSFFLSTSGGITPKTTGRQLLYQALKEKLLKRKA